MACGNPRESLELIKYVSIASTQDTARQLAFGSHPLPFAVLAQTQSRGRGRLGRHWYSPQGGLWLTIALHVPSPESVRQAALVAASSVAHALQALTAREALVKWPNDLLLGRKKVCGILAETLVFPSRTVLLVGIGINVNNTIDGIASPLATSLTDELNSSVNTDDLSTSIVTEVDRDVSTLAEQGFSPFRPWLQAHLALVGEIVTVEFNGQRETGSVLGLSETGALLLADANGLAREVDAGSVYYW